MPGQRVWLDVPFAEKDAAKAAGARWDPQVRRWFDPSPPTAGLARWAALPDLPAVLPGEDRSFGSGLFVDPVPTSCWFTNVRSCVSQRDWERLRRMITGRAGHRCEVCGAGEDRSVSRWLEAHERWDYDETAGVQTLRRLICLCSDCHCATHFGLAELRGRRDEALEHLRAVTGMSEEQAEDHVIVRFVIWETRSERSWTLDLSMLTEAGVTVTPPPVADDRVAVAEYTTDVVREQEHHADPPAATGTNMASLPQARQQEAPEAGVSSGRGSWPARVLQRLRRDR